MNVRMVERVSNKRRCTVSKITLLKDASPMVTRLMTVATTLQVIRSVTSTESAARQYFSHPGLRNSNGAPSLSNFANRLSPGLVGTSPRFDGSGAPRTSLSFQPPPYCG